MMRSTVRAMNITPATVAANRTARLVREANTPVYTSTREGQEKREREAALRWAEEYTHSENADQQWCHVCSRPTDHFGEHSDEQLLEFYYGRGRRFRR